MVIGLFEHKDLTPREVAAAHLFATIANHRANAWYVEHSNPKNWPHSTQLNPQRATELNRWTIEAINDYAAFIPEREADMLRGLIKVPAITPSHTPIEANNSVIKVIPQQTERERQAAPIIEFITLREVFDAIKARVSAPTGSGEFADEITSSEAAGLLHQALSNNSKSRPHWVEENKISGKPIFNDTAVYPEAMAMLEHASGYHDRCIKNRNNHIHSCLNAGLDPNKVDDGISLADLPFSGLQFIFRLREIGFDRAELVEFLDKKIDHNLTPSPAPEPQENSTLNVELGKTPSPAPVPQVAPVGATDASDSSSLTTVPVWRLIKTPERLPCYRWPLYQFLEAALTAGQPCPKAQHVLDAWKLTPPTRLEVIQLPTRDELEYELGTGEKKRARVKQIQAAIEGLLSK